MFITIFLTLLASETKSENVLSDFAHTAQPDLTKVVFFYKTLSGGNKSIPFDHFDLNNISTYLTINQGINLGFPGFPGSGSGCSSGSGTATGTDINFYQYPDFRKLNYSKHEDTTWMGAWNMNDLMLKQWDSFSHDPFKTPTYAWYLITIECFKNTTQIDLYDYSALLPSIVPLTYLYVFTWKTKDSLVFKCTQSTYSLIDNKIVCSVFQNLECSPPFLFY